MPVRSRSPAPHIRAGQGIEQAPPTPPTGQACPYSAPIAREPRAGKDSCGHLSPFSGIRDRGLAKRPACSLSPTINPSSQLVSSRTEMRPEAGSTPHLQSVMTTFPQFSDSVASEGGHCRGSDATDATDAPACCAASRSKRSTSRSTTHGSTRSAESDRTDAPACVVDADASTICVPVWSQPSGGSHTCGGRRRGRRRR